MNVTIPCILTNNKKKPMILRNPEGWESYKLVSDKHAQEIKDLIDNTMTSMSSWFGCTLSTWAYKWKALVYLGKIQQTEKETKKWQQGDFQEQQEELDNLLEEGSSAKDLNSKIYKLKDLINGPKIKSTEPTCIIDPVSGELITDRESIKISLDHCANI